MLDINEIKKILKNHKEKLRKKFGVKKIGIFGSYAREEQKKSSDVDILVKFYEDIEISLLDFVRLQNYLSDLLGIKVDLVLEDGIRPELKKQILSEVIYL